MSLTASLNTALTGLNVAQRGIATVSDNVANVNTQGYARKEVVQTSNILGGVGAGVSVEEVRRVTDQFLNREFRLSQSDLHRFESMGRLHDQAISLLGDPTGDNHIVAQFDKVLASVGTLAANPETTAVRSATIEQMKRFTEDLDRLADGVGDLRRQADARVAETVETINQIILDAHELNTRVLGESTPTASVGLIELRDRKLDELSQFLDIQITPQRNGDVLVSTTGGLPLIDRSARQFQHPGLTSGGIGEVFEPLGLVRVDSNTGDVSSVNTNIDERVLSGTLRGLLQMRDNELNDMALELGAFAAKAIDELNRVHNSFTAVPPPAALTGPDLGTLATDPHGFTGIAEFHAFDANNAVIATATIDFAAIGGTVNDVINAVNAGLGGTGSLALTNGAMSFSVAGGATGVAISQDATTPSDNNGRGFSHRFGLNNLIDNSGPPHFQTGVSAATAHGFTGTINLEMVGPSNQRPLAASIDMGAIGGTFGELITQLNTDFAGVASFSLSADGQLVTTNATGFSDFRLEPVGDGTARGGSGTGLSDFFGIGSAVRSGMAADTQVRTDIQGNPNLLSLAQVDASGTPAVFVGDNAGAIELQSLSFATSDFAGAGRLPAMTATVSEFGSELMARAGEAARDVATRIEDREALVLDLEQRVSEVSGVNVDEEMARLIQLQAAFNAATRVISATNEMFDALLQLR